MSLLNIILVVQACIKVQFYLRVNESFGLLVQLVAQCLIDVTYFSVFFFAWILVFSLLYRILGMDVDGASYQLLNKFVRFSI